MKKITILLAFFIAGIGFSQALEVVVEQNAIAIQYAKTITVENLKEDLTI